MRINQSDWYKTNNLFIEGIPLCVDFLQVILKLLGAGSFGSVLDQALAEGADVLELRLQRINVLFLESLKTNGTNHNKCFKSAQITMPSVLFGGSLNRHDYCSNCKGQRFHAALVLLDFLRTRPN